ncbi:MAG TPA: efflux RND transporter periplasmic adaptor subunit [Vicinamibacterales bacterium]|nr:efflux RND transporter periplasmic adaptor subunit [Vicinamibacterales bacterium]
MDVREETESPARGGRFAPLAVVAVVLLVAAGTAFWGITSRARAMTALARRTDALAVTTVSVIHPARGAPRQEIVLPGTTQAYTDAPIYARTNGYLKARYVDIGAHVRAGQLLAVIETPEVDQELQQARADLATAEATLRLARITALRYRHLIATDAVSQQDLDNANGDFAAKQAIVESARYNVKRLEELEGFSRIVAPFAGVITARNVDVGALIDSGSSAKELFHIASTRTLRVYVDVPELYVREATPGLPAALTLAEWPGRRFTGRIVRTAGAIDVASRTMRTEIDVANPHEELLPGAYVQVHLELPTPASTFRLPSDALIFRSAGLQVATVVDGNRVQLQTVTPGRDFGTQMEILAGLTGDESIIVNPPDSIVSGEHVQVVPATAGDGGAR